MSAVVVAAANGPGPASPEAAAPAAVEFHYTQTDSFVALLQQLGASLLVSTYQANKPLVARAAGSGLSLLVRTFERPMGLAVDAQRLTIGTRNQIWSLRNAPDIAPRVEPAGQHDACFLPRSSHVTGDIGVHELAWVREELWIVNTRFSCPCALHPRLQLRAALAAAIYHRAGRRGSLPPQRPSTSRWTTPIRRRPGRDRHGRRVADEQAARRLLD
jgi:uncharacterized protein DUF4915